jgi:hypothetical protein
MLIVGFGMDTRLHRWKHPTTLAALRLIVVQARIGRTMDEAAVWRRPSQHGML